MTTGRSSTRRQRRRVLRVELLRHLGFLLLGGAAGALLHEAVTGLLLALVLLVARHLRLAAALHAWAQHPRRELPETSGLWGDLFRLLSLRQLRFRRRKQQLAAILGQFRRSTEALPDGVVVLTARGEILWFNLAAQTLLGLRAPQDRGLRVAHLLRAPEFTEYLAQKEKAGEIEIPSPVNEEITLSARLIPYGEGQMLLMVRDVSERRQLDAARRDFIANASHELRTPLTVMRGYLEMMSGETGAQGALQPWEAPLAEMNRQAERMGALVDDMLKLASMEAHTTAAPQERLDVAQLLGQVIEDARALSAGRHQIEARIDRRWQLVGRAPELRSVFGNLLQNAIQYTPEGGTIEVRWWGDQTGAHLSVRDSGIGIAPEDIPRLTERFYRVDPARSRATGGTGLGLSIVKHGLENHEGRLEVRSRLGSGSTFICHFPWHRLHLRDER